MSPRQRNLIRQRLFAECGHDAGDPFDAEAVIDDIEVIMSEPPPLIRAVSEGSLFHGIHGEDDQLDHLFI